MDVTDTESKQYNCINESTSLYGAWTVSQLIYEPGSSTWNGEKGGKNDFNLQWNQNVHPSVVQILCYRLLICRQAQRFLDCEQQHFAYSPHSAVSELSAKELAGEITVKTGSTPFPHIPMVRTHLSSTLVPHGMKTESIRLTVRPDLTVCQNKSS